MHLVDEQNDVLQPPHLRQNVADTLLKFAPVFGSGDDAGHVQGVEPLAPQSLRHPACGDILGHALDDGGLSHARLTDEGGIVLLPAGEDLQDGLDLPLPADDGLGTVRPFHQIHAELLQKSGILHRLLLSGVLALVQIGKQQIRIDGAAGQHTEGAAVLVPQHGEKKALGCRRRGFLCSQRQGALCPDRQPLRQDGQPPAAAPEDQQPAHQLLGRKALPLKLTAGSAPGCHGDGQQQMLRAHIAVSQDAGQAPRLPKHPVQLLALLCHGHPPLPFVHFTSVDRSKKFYTVEFFAFSLFFHCNFIFLW